MKKVIFVFFVMCITFVVVSCRSFQISGMEISEQPTAGNVIGDFDITVGINKFLGSSGGTNLFNVSSEITDPRIVDAVKLQILNMGGSRAINVKVEHRASFLNLLLNGLTFNIWAPSYARVTGTVIR